MVNVFNHEILILHFWCEFHFSLPICIFFVPMVRNSIFFGSSLCFCWGDHQNRQIQSSKRSIFCCLFGGPHEYQLFGKSDEAGRQWLCLRCCLAGPGGKGQLQDVESWPFTGLIGLTRIFWDTALRLEMVVHSGTYFEIIELYIVYQINNWWVFLVIDPSEIIWEKRLGMRLLDSWLFSWRHLIWELFACNKNLWILNFIQ